jgi:hypothetical protein
MSVRSVIRLFGGVRPLARALGHVNPTTVHGWYVRGVVPWPQVPVVIEAAAQRGLSVDVADLLALEEVSDEFYDDDFKPRWRFSAYRAR